MFCSRFTHSRHAGSGITGRTVRRAATRAAGLAALTVALLGTLSSPAMAQGVWDHRAPIGGTLTVQPGGETATTSNNPLNVDLLKLKCLKVSNDNTWPRPDRDEPYVIVFTADLQRGSGWVNVTEEFQDVDSGSVRQPSWQGSSWGGTMWSQQPIRSSNDYIFLAALMESDVSSERMAIRNKVANTLIPKLASYRAAGMSRAAMNSNLMADMNLAIDSARKEDDRIGGAQSILFDASDLQAAQAGRPVDRLFSFVGNGSQYELTFRISPSPPLR